MKRFTDAVVRSVETQNWFSAIALALTLPDICGALETPREQNGVRYKRWFKQWMEPTYSVVIPVIGPHVFLSADNCWALRCSYLHAGNGEIRPGNIQSALESFHFIEPPHNGRTIHMNKVGEVLQLQVDKFCDEMIAAVEEWQGYVAGDLEIEARRQELLQVHSFAQD
jgi:hypothetical protein